MAYDPNDPADKAAVQDLIDAALAPLASKNKELLGEVKKLKRGAEIDPADFERVERERDEAQAQLADANKAAKAHAKAAEDATAALTGEQGYTQRLLVDNGLRAALAEAGVTNAVQAKAAAALIREQSKIEVKIDGADRKAVVGDKDLLAHVKEWSQSDEGKHFVSAPANTGGGATGGTGAGTGAKTGNLGGSRAERVAGIAARFPDLNP